MALDGITCQLLTDELNATLQGVRIEKVFMPDKYTVVLHFRGYSGIKKLLISIDPGSPRINLTDSARENPKMPPSFCMLLRKYIAGAHIEAITNPGYERIVEFQISNTDELYDKKKYRLIVELMGRFSNIILVNQGGKIIDSAIHVDFSVSRVREVMPARIYEYPPVQDKLPAPEALELCTNGKLPILDQEVHRPIDKALLNSIKGLSPILARQLCHKSGIDDRSTPVDFSDSDKQSLIKETKEFLSQVVNHTYTPALYLSEDGEPEDFSPMSLVGFADKKECDSISECIELYYQQKDNSIDLENKKNRLMQIVSSALSRLMKKQEIHRQDEEDGLKADNYKLYGDLLLSYTYMVKPGQKEVTCLDYTKDPAEDITIQLDPTLNASQNAQDYYKRFRKSKRKLELAREYLHEDELAISYLRSLRTAISSAQSTEDVEAIDAEIRMQSDLSISNSGKAKKQTVNNGDPNKTVGKSKSGKASSRALREAAKRANQGKKNKQNNAPKELSYRKYITSDGYEIYCGRNNIQNDNLTFHVADKNDWWFHVKGLPGTHVILKAHKGEEFPSDDAVIEAAQCAAWFSKSIILEEHQISKDTSSTKLKAEIDYCQVSHVKKIPGAKPGMVIYEGYYSINVVAKEPENKV